MKHILYLPFFFYLFSCSNEDSIEIETRQKETQFNDSKTQFDICFPTPDSNFHQSVIGCSSGFYKVISDEFVLHFYSELSFANDTCVQIKMDTLVNLQNFYAELLVFKKGEASLTNFCTDISITNANRHMYKLGKCFGQVTYGRSDYLISSGSIKFKTSIRINHLTFIDSVKNKRIEIKNELMWKIEDLGTAG